MQTNQLFDLLRRVEVIPSITGVKLWYKSAGQERVYIATKPIGKAYLDLRRSATVLDYISPSGHAGPMYAARDQYVALLHAMAYIGYPPMMSDGSFVKLETFTKS
jgi:hypothetical protein